MTLTPSEYDISYFDGLKARKLSLPEHPAGYSRYENTWAWNYYRIQSFINEFSMSDYIGKKVLELGCAKGFLVKALRDLGVRAFGIEWSQYAIDESVIPVNYRFVGDVRTDLVVQPQNAFDLVYSWGFFECLDETEIANVVSNCNRIGKNQIHIFDSYANLNYYNIQPLSYWQTKGFDNGTILAEFPDWNKVTV